ncbi:uncharacterized protein LOC113468990 [Diaphorina citri]|uniref:Uncharacterized protein LOC113468990 n=1 Tax=Diaphorina citri TaxID=121845 RepID=A0A3Q0J5E2_DIACI|nr:uncharacterized protein LOC113468990 [Diaphorina citri]
MINYTLGHIAFTESIHSYLTTYQFRSSTADDLLEAFDQTYTSGRKPRNRTNKRSGPRNMDRTNNHFDQNMRKSEDFDETSTDFGQTTRKTENIGETDNRFDLNTQKSENIGESNNQFGR